ncbi:MAG: hypothetical protein HY696_03295 [Deltaproteobacteria bacterium]|nr:hypothetical protein [Deltaproteobacteria bacterium]
MRRTATLIVTLGLIAGLGACKKAPEATGTTTPETKTETTAPAQPEAGKAPEATTPSTAATPTAGGLTAEAIADSLSKAVCERMAACNQNSGLSAADCTSGMSKDLAQNLPEKAKAVDKGGLDGCVAAIAKATCDELNSPEPPKGCEFMN